MRNKFSRVQMVLEAAKRLAKDNRVVLNRLEDIQIHSEYAEPGYSCDGPILLGNWNPIKWEEKEDDLIHLVGEILEKIGCELEWEDEWTSCSDCGKLVRTEPDCYSWTPAYAIVNECELVCQECLKADPIAYLEEMEGNADKAITFDIDLAKYGYVRVDQTYENGWYGTTDNPKDIAKKLRMQGIERFIFTIDRQGQFNTEFSVWVHESENNKSEGEEDVQ